MARSRKFGNDTLDVINKGCLDLYNGIACGRVTILILLGTITFVLVATKIIKYHGHKHSQMHHYTIFYVSAVQCIICAAGFVLGTKYPQINFGANFFKLLQFILICHLHWSVAARSRHRDDIVQHVVNPILCLYTLYCTTVVLMGMVDVTGTWTECLRPYWLMLSGADFISVQLFAIVALFLTHGNNHPAISALMLPATSSQARDLWLVTAVYEVSAAISIVFDAVMSLVGKEETGCSAIYNHDQLYYSSMIIVVTTLKYFLPTWTLLGVFQPTRVKSRPSEVTLTSHYNTDGTCQNHYRRMFFSQNTGLSAAAPYPTMAYATDSPIYGSYGEYFYPDSSPDASPTIAQCWNGMEDNAYHGFEKHFINIDQKRDILENQYRIERNRQNLERSLRMDPGPTLERDDDEEEEGVDGKTASKNGNLTTINEEGGITPESPQE
ncbi:uncharacterized protein LOC105699332 [Orussus abietinus]|uniref:uncharacterized protein LOC105699332 n=1 Tax=Orussus abietinus TaxID=222816 RepID=UPI000626D23C|nr:uncharacterized protein LOC105699332 [Orussus abietinus]XP_012279645.1 uncharacterized protein LOC105699332 [Orussus abietinus]XP_012279647.1 uncharacterized protein LOC105699332 [Orussus abietinus]